MWDTIEDMKKFQKEMNALFSRHWNLPEGHEHLETKDNLLSSRKPLVDIKETDTNLIVTFELPGVEKKNIQLDVKEDRLSLKVERKQEVMTVRHNVHLEERSYKGFYRMVELPHPVIPDQTKATYANGILEVTIPKGTKKEKKTIYVE